MKTIIVLIILNLSFAVYAAEELTAEQMVIGLAMAGTPEKVEKLVAEGYDVNAHDKDGLTCLHVIAQVSKTPEVVKKLIELGADVNAKYKGIYTPLYVARKTNNTSIVDVLLEAGAQETHFPEELNIIAGFKTVDDVNDFFEKGYNINMNVLNGDTPLSIAVVHTKNLEIIDRLIELGAEVNKKNDAGMTPVFGSVQNNETAVVQKLIELGADLSCVRDTGETLLHFAVVNKIDPCKMTEFLLAQGLDVNAKNNDGVYVLHYAIIHLKNFPEITPKIIRILVDAGADINAKFAGKYDPVYLALMLNNQAALNALIDIKKENE